MKTTRYSTSRQKSCQPCSNAKAKCDRKATSCSRCALRELACTYSQASRVSLHNTSAPEETETIGSLVSVSGSLPLHAISPTTQTSSLAGESIQPGASLDGLVSPASTNLADTSRSAHQRRHQVTSHTTRGGSAAPLDFSHLDFVCPINANDIQKTAGSNLTWHLSSGRPPKRFPRASQPSHTESSNRTRLLRSDAPIIASRHFYTPFMCFRHYPTNTPLSTCFSLIRSCEKPLPGSEGVLAEVLQREMNKLYEQYGTYDDDSTLLAAFQTYLVYTLVLYYRLGGRDDADPSFLRQAIMNLQEIACACSARGLVCSAEQHGARPRWESWIVAETKRRTLFTMYLLDNMLTAKEGLPTFLGTELLGLCVDELWAIPADMDEASLVERRRRVDQWLEGVDEFGTMMYAVTSCTHGG